MYEAWVHRQVGLSTYPENNAVAVGKDGSVIVTRASGDADDDFYTAKFAPNGIPVWEQRYSNSESSVDRPYAIAIDGAGDVFVTGDSFNARNPDFYTAKLSSRSGIVIWERRYNSPEDTADLARALAIDKEGDVIVVGYGYKESQWQLHLVKYRGTNGTVIWEQWRESLGNSYTEPIAAKVDSSNNVIVMASSSGQDFYVAKYSGADGYPLWEKSFNGPANTYDSPRGLAVDGSGSAIVTGISFNGRNTDYCTVKFGSRDGTISWVKLYNSPENNDDSPQGVVADGWDNVIVTGWTSRGFYTAKYAGFDGRLIWENRYEGIRGLGTYANAIAIDPHGNPVVAGESDGDTYIAKYASSSGTLIWEHRYNGSANGGDSIPNSRSLAIGEEGTIAITGWSDGDPGSATKADYLTASYREVFTGISIEMIQWGAQIKFLGTPGHLYNIERTTDLSGVWEVIASKIPAANGLVEHLDSNWWQSTSFYRIQKP